MHFVYLSYKWTAIANNQQKMRLKLKQSNNLPKKILLPTIKNNNQARYTPTNKHVNQSLPKITSNHLDQRTYATIKQKVKTESSQLSQLQKQKFSSNKKRQNNITPILFEQDASLSKDEDEGNITSNFKREIQKNLIMIKKQKEYQRKDRTRYNTPRHHTYEPELVQPHQIIQPIELTTRQQKCFTEDDNVFRKLNQIIIKSHAKSIHQVQQSRAISYSSYINKKDSESVKKLDQKRKLEDEKIQRNASQLHRELFKGDDFKNQANYLEWRKLSIQSDGSKNICYNVSSFDNQAARLEKIRSKNEMSLKKYIEGKFYLQRLANFRESTQLLLKESREELI